MSFVRVPPDSTGKKVYTKQQTVGADTVEAQVMHLADADNPDHLLAVDVRGSASVRFAEGQPILSGFGSLKTTGQRALGVYESSADSYDDLFTIETASGGLSTYSHPQSSIVLSTTSASGSSVKRTTNRYHYYLPGSGNYVVMTIACGDIGKAGNLRRWGVFDDEDGVFFELYETTLNVVIRNSTSGTPVETKIPQSSWNVDKADGTGTSGFDLDLTKVNVWWMDYQWLGAGRVRFGVFEPNGARLVLHQIENAGQNPLPYMHTGTLPLRTENTNFGVTGSTSELRECCMAIYTEGTFKDYTFWRNADLEALGVTVSSNTHLLSVRSKQQLNGRHNAIQSYPETLSIYTDQPVAVTLYEDTTLTGATYTLVGQGSLDGDTAATVTDTGHRFNTWYFSAGAHNVDLSQYFEVNDEGILCRPDGTQINWSFVAAKLGATNATVSINLGYKELW